MDVVCDIVMLLLGGKSLERRNVSTILKIKGTEVSRPRINIMIGWIQSRRIRIRNTHIQVCMGGINISFGYCSFHLHHTFYNFLTIKLSCSLNQLKNLNELCEVLLYRITSFNTTNLTGTLLVYRNFHFEFLNHIWITHINGSISILSINVLLEFGQEF